MWKLAQVLIGLAYTCLVAGAAQAEGDKGGFAADAVSKDGAIRVPPDFRHAYAMIGVWTVKGEDGQTAMHAVYARKEVVDSFRKTGVFPDGAVLVKELLSTKSEKVSTGEATSAAEPIGAFVMIKDGHGRFAGNPLWGDGWGWAFFKGTEQVRTVSTDYKADCLSCHEPARGSDLVYSYAYPVLH